MARVDDRGRSFIQNRIKLLIEIGAASRDELWDAMNDDPSLGPMFNGGRYHVLEDLYHEAGAALPDSISRDVPDFSPIYEEPEPGYDESVSFEEVPEGILSRIFSPMLSFFRRLFRQG